MSKILIISDKNKLPIPENLKNVKNTYEQVEDFMRNSVKKKTIKGIYKTNQFHDFVMLKNQFLFELTNTELIQLLCAKNIKLQFVIKKKKRIGKKYEMYNGNCEVQKIISIIKEIQKNHYKNITRLLQFHYLERSYQILPFPLLAFLLQRPYKYFLVKHFHQFLQFLFLRYCTNHQ